MKIMSLSGLKKLHTFLNNFSAGWTANRSVSQGCVGKSSAKLGISEIFDFPSALIDPKIYLYLVASKFFGCFEKL